VFPAIFFYYHDERMRNAIPRSASTYNRVKFLRIIKSTVATQIRKEWSVPVRQDVSGNFTHCAPQSRYTSLISIVTSRHYDMRGRHIEADVGEAAGGEAEGEIFYGS